MMALSSVQKSTIFSPLFVVLRSTNSLRSCARAPNGQGETSHSSLAGGRTGGDSLPSTLDARHQWRCQGEEHFTNFLLCFVWSSLVYKTKHREFLVLVYNESPCQLFMPFCFICGWQNETWNIDKQRRKHTFWIICSYTIQGHFMSWPFQWFFQTRVGHKTWPFDSYYLPAMALPCKQKLWQHDMKQKYMSEDTYSKSWLLWSILVFNMFFFGGTVHNLSQKMDRSGLRNGDWRWIWASCLTTCHLVCKTPSRANPMGDEIWTKPPDIFGDDINIVVIHQYRCKIHTQKNPKKKI